MILILFVRTLTVDKEKDRNHRVLERTKHLRKVRLLKGDDKNRAVRCVREIVRIVTNRTTRATTQPSKSRSNLRSAIPNDSSAGYGCSSVSGYDTSGSNKASHPDVGRRQARNRNRSRKVSRAGAAGSDRGRDRDRGREKPRRR